MHEFTQQKNILYSLLIELDSRFHIALEGSKRCNSNECHIIVNFINDIHTIIHFYTLIKYG